MGEAVQWVAIALTALALTAGCVAYIHAQISRLYVQISANRKELEEKMSASRREIESELDKEIVDRRRELDRMEKTLEGFSHVASAVVGLSKSVEHMAESMRMHQSHTDKSLDEVKKTVRAIDMQLRGALESTDVRQS